MRRLRYSCSGGIVCALEPAQLLWFVSCRGFSRVSLSGWNKENFCLSAVAFSSGSGLWDSKETEGKHWLLPGCLHGSTSPPSASLL